MADRSTTRPVLEAQAAPGAGEADALEAARLQLYPGHLLRRCQQRAIELFVAEVGRRGPTPRQFALLLTVAQNPGMSQTELVGATGIDRSTIADMLDRLAKRGLVKRTRAAGDQRANILTITPAGLALTRHALGPALRAQARIMEPLPERLHGPFLEALALMAFAGVPEETPGSSAREDE